MIKVGIPRGLLYFDYYPFWLEFLKGLDLEVILSPKTNKDMLNSGIACCVDEACLPVKIYHGHVEYLKDKTDYILMPRYYSLQDREYNCPKHLGITNMVENSIENLPFLITPKVVIKEIKDLKIAAREVGRLFTNNYRKINKAIYTGLKVQYEFESREIFQPNNSINKKLLIIGHGYNIHDDFINMGLLEKLKQENMEVILPEDVSHKEIEKYSNVLEKRMFWTNGRRIIGSAFSLMDRRLIDGIIYISAFGCGLDSVLLYIVEEQAIKENIPMMTMTFDEQTGEAGFNTRLEAFLDMIDWRCSNENNFPSLW